MKKITMTQQNIDVLDYLVIHGSITTADAFEKLNITRLSARIYDLKHLGYNIIGKMMTRKADDGRIIRWKEYRLAA